MSYLINRSATFLNCGCDETLPEAGTLGSHTTPLRLVSKSAASLKPRHDCSADHKICCYKCLGAATVLSATNFSTCGRQSLAVPPSAPCKVITGFSRVLFTRSSWIPGTSTVSHPGRRRFFNMLRILMRSGGLTIVDLLSVVLRLMNS